MTERRAGALAAVAAAVLALAYCLTFRSYGLNFEDEGAILYTIQRVAAGDVPYVDFMTGYTPGYYYLAASLWRLTSDLPTLRAVLALVHAATVAGLALLIARVASPVLAFVVPLLYLGFIPAFPGGSCAFNIPYPAWFATLAWVAMALALVRFVRRRDRGSLAAAGLAAAAALATKPNAGVFAIAAAAAVTLMMEGPATTARPASVALWWATWGGILVGPWLTMGGWPGVRDALAYLVPLSAALLALPARVRTRRAGLVGDLTVLLGTFTAVSVPWVAFFWSRLGTEAFLRDVLLIGSGAAELYYLAYPPFEPWALLVAAGATALAAAGFGLRAGRLRLLTVAVVAALGLAASLVAIRYASVMPERTVWSLIWQLESAGFPLTLVTHAVGVAWLWRGRGLGCELPAALLLCALFMHLQLYPRADFTHLIVAVPLTMTFAAFLHERVLSWWRAALAGQWTAGAARAVTPITVAVVVAVVALRVSPSFAARFAEPGPRLPFAVAPVGVEESRSAVLADLGAAATRLAALVSPGGASLTFPAVDVLLFLTETRNPTPFVYFFPGRPDHREEAEIVDVLARVRPAALATLNEGFSFFDDAPPYYFLLRRFVRAHYGLRERSGRFDVLARGDGALPAPVDSTHADPAARAVAALAAHPLVEAAPRLLLLATDDDAWMRRAALTSLLDRLAGSDTGLETWVARAGLDRRREILLLRTIRDTRDARAATYLFAAVARADSRIVNEALGAMFVTRAQLIAAEHLWAGGREPERFPAREELVAVIHRTLADPAAAPRASAFAAHLAGLVGNAASVPLLRARLDGDAATAASAAAAVARLAPAGVACELVAMLDRPARETLVLTPSTVLGLAEQAGPVGAETRACLARAVGRPGPGREAAIWVTAALADPALGEPLRDALTSDVAAVRRAAAWALGELPDDPAVVASLTRAAAKDGDGLVRRLATAAVEKHAGRVPRATASAPQAHG